MRQFYYFFADCADLTNRTPACGELKIEWRADLRANTDAALKGGATQNVPGFASYFINGLAA